MSLPSRERGLKCPKTRVRNYRVEVAPFAGAWIEMPVVLRSKGTAAVAPFAGAWIEIPDMICP